MRANKTKIAVFEGRKIRRHWDDKNEKWWFSVVDIVQVLTNQADFMRSRKYWNKLAQRLREEGSEVVTKCHQLKMIAADGKRRLTDEITFAWAGLRTKGYKRLKGLKRENLRDNMTNLELVLNMLAEASTTEISKKVEPKTFQGNKKVAREGGSIVGTARRKLEKRIGKKVVTSLNARSLNLLGKDRTQGEK